MKKAYILLAALAALALGACNKEKAEVIVPSESGKVRLNINFDVTSPCLSTKAVKSGWESGDIIYCWFDENQSKDPDLTLTYDGSDWNASDVDAAIVANLKGQGELKFFWIGTNDLADWTYNDGSFTPAEGKGFPRLLTPSGNGNDNVYRYDAEARTLTGTLKWSYATNLQVVVTGLALSDGYRLNCGYDAWTKTKVNVTKNNVYAPNGNTFSYGVENADGVAFYLSMTKSGYNKPFNFTLNAPDNKEYVYAVKKTIQLDTDNTEASFYAVKIAKDKFLPSINGYAYVEMGDGLKWATMNVGATSPDGYGDYFAWGETEAKEDYSWSTYKWMQEGMSDEWYITKYTFADGETDGIWYDGDTFVGDGKTSLKDYDYADDAARQIWKGTWRIPTDAEWTALRNEDNFKWDWTGDYEGTGIAGMVVTSKVSGCEGNTIFLPAAGGRDGAGPYYAGSYGYYWASSLREYNSDFARRVDFYSGEVGRSFSARCRGFSVRPVSE